jgi:hypothetical protein
MKRYIYEACWTQELEDEIKSTPNTKSLIEEMYYRFGLKVYEKAKGLGATKSFLMTLDGLPYCEVFTEMSWNAKKEADELTYCYYSQYYSKARGKDENDKHTLRSTKLSKLMTTLEKNNAIMPDHTHLLTTDLLTDTMMAVKRKDIKTYKSMYDLEDTSKLQLLLEHAVNKVPLEGETLKGFQVILDKWIKTDHDDKQAKDKMMSMFGNEFYVIAETQEAGYAIASAKVTEFNNKESKYELIKPFQRVMSLDDYEHIDDIRAVLTMYKLFLEGQDKHRFHALSPLTREYYEDINVFTTYQQYPAGSSYIPLWTLIPTITE